MAPFTRFCTMAFSVGVGTKNAITQHSLRSNDATRGTKYTCLPGIPRNFHSQTYVASLATISDVLEDNSQSFFDSAPSAEDVDLSHLCELLGAVPRDLLSLKTTDDGVRGVYLNSDVSKDDIILSVPLDSCLRDDEPPAWFLETHSEDDSPALQQSAWATRLAASLIDKQLPSSSKGMDLWLELLPDAIFLRASLPIHWDEQVVSSAKCTALELAVDSAYFSRAEAIADLKMALEEHNDYEYDDDEDLLCDNALDLVQTRSCRVETNDGTVLRLLAPIFDFINHACTPNAGFALEDDKLVVRATKDLNAGDQILIDYGDSTRPHWKCLASYGFMPEYNTNEEEEEQNVAELYVHGRRFEVGPSTIPVDLVEAVEAQSERFYEETQVQEEPETVLTPDIAMRIAYRVSEVAFQLLLDSNQMYDDEGIAQFYEDAVDEEDKQEENQSPEDVISARLAASLRFAQHRTLLACANGLIDWATSQRDEEE